MRGRSILGGRNGNPPRPGENYCQAARAQPGFPFPSRIDWRRVGHVHLPYRSQGRVRDVECLKLSLAVSRSIV
jgi:hypothetical protein